MRDVTEQFHVTEIDPHELTHFLMSEFYSGTYSALDRIDIPDAKTPTVKIYFTAKGRVRKVESSLADKELQPVVTKLEELFLSPGQSQVRRIIAFADAPVTGTWECEAFTITAAPPEAPRPTQFSTDHPYILEVPMEITGDGVIDILRADRLRARYELLISLFAAGFQASRQKTLHAIWGRYTDVPDYGPPVPHLVQEFYSIPGHQLIAEQRTPLADPLIALVSDAEYFNRRRRMPDNDLDLPQSLRLWIDTALRCEEAVRNRLLRAAYWYRHAHEVWRLSQSASLVAAVQTVEVLLPTIKGEACPACQRDTSPGPTRKFRDFLQEYAPATSEEESKARDLLYRQRSKLTHGHELLVADGDVFATWTNPAHAFDDQTLEDALQVARIAAINWFIDHIRCSS